MITNSYYYIMMTKIILDKACNSKEEVFLIVKPKNIIVLVLFFFKPHNGLKLNFTNRIWSFTDILGGGGRGYFSVIFLFI